MTSLDLTSRYTAELMLKRERVKAKPFAWFRNFHRLLFIRKLNVWFFHSSLFQKLFDEGKKILQFIALILPLLCSLVSKKKKLFLIKKNKTPKDFEFLSWDKIWDFYFKRLWHHREEELKVKWLRVKNTKCHYYFGNEGIDEERMIYIHHREGTKGNNRF